MSTRRVSPRDLPFPAAGGAYEVIQGELRPQRPAPATAAADDAPAVVEPAPETAAATPPARPQGGRTSRSKE